MEVNLILNQLENNSNPVKILRQIITTPLKQDENWNSIAIKLEELIKQNNSIGKESILLASQALFSLNAKFAKERISDYLIFLLNCKSNDETFKLTITYGYLQLKTKKYDSDFEIFSSEICSLLFYIIQPHCTKYTKQSYFAHKVLYHWLLTTSTTNFWQNSSLELETSLEEIIFSNWQNSIHDVAKHNSTKIFQLYLKIMNSNYPGFTEFVLEQCMRNISWNHTIKFKILAAVCSALPDEFHFSYCYDKYVVKQLIDAVSISYLQKASSNVCEILLKKRILSIDNVVKVVEDYLYTYREKEHDETTYLIYKYILKHVFDNTVNPTKITQKSKFEDGCLYKIYLQSMEIDYNKSKNELSTRNLQKGCLKSDYQKAAYISTFTKYNFNEKFTIRHVMSGMFSWANTKSLHLRNEMIQNFYNLFNRTHKNGSSENYIYMLSYVYLLLEFCLGTCSNYQLRIFGLNILKNLLQLTNGDLAYSYVYNKEYLDLAEYDKICEDKNNIRNRLFKLVLDPANDVRMIAADLLLKYFLSKQLDKSDVNVLNNTVDKYKNSFEFCQAESAALLVKLLKSWNPNEDKLKFWISEAQDQLNCIKDDIYLAICNNKPFYGILIILLNSYVKDFQVENLEHECILSELLELLEDTVQFFTDTLLKPINSSEYKSSVAGIGVAIQNYSKCDELSLNPEQRNMFTCMWRSLKTTSEIAAEILTKSKLPVNIDRSCKIILSILLKCYHKGAIKAAGSTLYQVCRHLCEKNDSTLNLLENQIKYLINLTENNNEEAGFTIAFHSIISADDRQDRPFLHFAAETLLTFLENQSQKLNLGTDKEIALPCVLQLNFLQTLIEDKQLLSSITIYLEDVCIICLRYMQAKDFLIRNAGIQLYGAIIPRLTGQIAVENNFGYGYSIGHFVVYYPRLCKHILQSLEDISQKSKTEADFESYSHISNILVLLSKLYMGGCELTESEKANKFVEEVRACLKSFLKSHISYVRLLAAKVFVAFTEKSQLVKELVNLANLIVQLKSENELHGFLLAFTYLKEKISLELKPLPEKFTLTQLLRFWSRRCHQLGLKKPCFVVEGLLLKNPEILFILGYLQPINSEPLTIEELNSLVFPEKFDSFPGFQEFIEELIKQYCKYSNGWSNLEFIKILLMAPNFVYGVSFLKYCSASENIREDVEKIDRILNSTTLYKTEKVSLFDILQPEVVKSLASYRLFDRKWTFDDFGLKFTNTDKIQLAEQSILFRFLNETSQYNNKSYTQQSDICKKYFADLIRFGYDNHRNKILYPNTFFIFREEVPEVREVFQDEFEICVYVENEQETKLSGFCSKIYSRIIENMIPMSVAEYLKRCFHFKNVILDLDKNSFFNDLQILLFLHYLLDTVKSRKLNYAVQFYLSPNSQRLSSLENTISEVDFYCISNFNEYVDKKLIELMKEYKLNFEEISAL